MRDMLRPVGAGKTFTGHACRLRAGSDAGAFANRIGATGPESLNATATSLEQIDFYIRLIMGMIGGLTVVLVLVAAVGVFNATLLSMRERSHDVATLKAWA